MTKELELGIGALPSGELEPLVCNYSHDWQKDLANLTLDQEEMKVRQAIGHMITTVHKIGEVEIGGFALDLELYDKLSLSFFQKAGLLRTVVTRFGGNIKNAIDFAFPLGLKEPDEEDLSEDILEVDLDTNFDLDNGAGEEDILPENVILSSELEKADKVRTPRILPKRKISDEPELVEDDEEFSDSDEDFYEIPDAMRLYLQDIGSFKLFSKEEEARAARKLWKGQVSAELLRLVGEKLSASEEHKFGSSSIFKSPIHEGETLQVFEKRRREGNQNFLEWYKSLDEDRKRELVIRYRKNMAESEGVYDNFLSRNLRLVVAIAKRYQGRGMTLIDLIQEGSVGLSSSLSKYDARKGFKFSTYATWWIRQAITRSIADKGHLVRMPVHAVEMLNKIRRLQGEMLNYSGRIPTSSELASEAKERGFGTESGVEFVIEALYSGRTEPRSINETFTASFGRGQASDAKLEDFLSDPNAEDEIVEGAETNALRDALSEAISSFPSRSRLVMELRYGLADGRPRTLEEVGRQFGVSRERIRQIEAMCLRKLRHPARAKVLKGFLNRDQS